MGKTSKVVVCGAASVGKTAILQQVIYGDHVVGQNLWPTIEDTYVAYIDTDRGTREKIRFYDTGGAADGAPVELPRHYHMVADGFILVYDITSQDSFKAMRALRKEIDKLKEKKDVSVICLGNKSDQQEHRMVTTDAANLWGQREKVKVYEVSAADRSTLLDPFISLASRLTQPPSKSSLFRKSKEKSQDS